MSDVERDPTRTEDVEEALEALEQLRRMVREDAELLADPDRYEETICDVLCALRSRLEGVEEERDRWRAEFDKASDNLAAVCEELGAARRRADRLEEAVGEALEKFKQIRDRTASYKGEKGHVCDYSKQAESAHDTAEVQIDRLRSALDSREDEGEVKIHGNDDYQPGLDYPNPVHADEPEGDERTTKRKEICECGHPKWMHSIGGRTGPRGRCAENICVCTKYRRDPSPTDEPEGDEQWECPVCYTVVSGKGTNDRVFVCPNADCPQTTVSKADTFRYQPTDEPVSREGEERLYVIVKGAGPDVQFVEIENHVGKSVSVPRRPAEGDGYSRIGPLYRRPAPTDEPESGEGVEYEEVDRFAALMRDRLYVNRHRGKSWKDETDEWLLTRLRDELRELEEALPGRGFTTEQERKAIANEAADVANFAMMIADNVLRHSGGDGLERPTHADARSEGDEPEALRFARACAEIALDELDEAKSEVKGVLRNLARLSDRSEGEGETNQIYVKCRPLDSTFDQAPTDESDGDEGAIEKWCSNCGHPVQDHPYIDPDGTVYCDEPLDEPVSGEEERND